MSKFYVGSEVGQLRRVMLHRPNLSLKRLTPSNCQDLLFDDVLSVERAGQEHDKFAQVLRDQNVEVFLLTNLLAETLDVPEAKAWLLQHQVSDYRLGTALANDVRQGDAHEALSDVYATLGMARLLRQHQPRLWEYALKLRDKRHVAGLLDPFAMQPLLHVSQRYPASRLCAAVVLPLAAHPAIANRVIVFDLDGNEDDLLQHDAGDIADRLYTPAADLPPGVARVPLKEVHLNRSPMLVPWAHLRAEDFQRLGLDADALQAKADRLRAHGPALAEKARQVFAGGREYADSDVDGSIYAGFIGEGDKRLCVQVRSTPPAELGTRAFEFRDPRLPELLFRYRARNWPDTLDATGRERWDDYRRQRLAEGSGLSEYGFEGFFAEIQALRATHAGDGARLVLLDQLEQWGHQLQSQL